MHKMASFDKLAIKPSRRRINNWSNTLACYPGLVFEPTSAEEVQLIVNEARKQGRRIRPVGEHASPGEAFMTGGDDWMLRMSRIDHLNIDKQSRKATIGTGVTIRRANKELYEQGLSFPVIGSIDEISVGGLFAAADHGSSMSHASSGERAVACTLVTADGRIRTVHRDAEDLDEANLFRATGSGGGATGIIIDITFELDDAFGLTATYEEICVRELLKKGNEKGGLIDLAKRNEYVKIWYFPNTTWPGSTQNDAILWGADKTAPPPYPKPNTATQDLQKKMIHILHATGVFICTYLLTSLMPRFNMVLRYFQARGLPMKQEPIAGPVAQLMDCLYWQLVQEWAVPIAKEDNDGAIQALRDLLDFLDRDKVIGGGLTAPFEIRFSRCADTFWLSPLSHKSAEAVIWIEPIVYKPLNLPVPERYERLFEILAHIGRKYGGKPHIAKPRPPMSAGETRKMYEHIDDWNKTVRNVDPQGMFWSDWLDKQFGLEQESQRQKMNGKETF
ncbi:FAD-binding domain-containing protein [Cystobasidium minutum MCA 4210]|uniref:FAD-binding domain-containing protein n=1 Tax=Cystobasidium minutum MCA 4210 TaxID=1397322 RepID=UPI0034CD09C2|eukprot:jgi/Rhomi1/99274/CE99273_1480